MYIWLTLLTFTFDDWKLEALWSFIDVLTMMGDGWSFLSSFDSMSKLVVEFGYFGCLFMVCSLLNSFELSLILHKSSGSGLPLSTLFTLPMTLFTLQRVVIFTFIMRLFSQLLCPNMFIGSITIIPRIFKSISFCLIGFWESWLFNYHLNLIQSFPTIKLMAWHGTKGFPSLDVSWVYVSNLISSHWGNPNILVY